MKVFIINILILFTNDVICQPHIKYSYDNSGNRTQRFLVPLKIAGIQIKDSSIYDNVGISVFPNPVFETFHISINGEEEKFENCIIKITDASGKNLLLQKLQTGMNDIDFSQYKSGIYYIKILLDDEFAEYKIVKL